MATTISTETARNADGILETFAAQALHLAQQANGTDAPTAPMLEKAAMVLATEMLGHDEAGPIFARALAVAVGQTTGDVVVA